MIRKRRRVPLQTEVFFEESYLLNKIVNTIDLYIKVFHIISPKDCRRCQDM